MKTKPVQPTVVYIVGVGHSGSTLLDMLLGAHEQVLGVGELDVLNTQIQQPCTCGNPLHHCDVWQPVVAEVTKPIRVFQSKWALLLGKLHFRDRHGDVVDEQKVLQRQEKVYELLQESSGQSMIVDSSKFVDRALLLAESSRVDLRIIYLTRDPRGVTHSFCKKYGYGVRQLVRWPATTLKLLWGLFLLRRRGVDVLHVRYEDVTTNPHDTLASVCDWLDLPADPQMVNYTDAEQHQCGGNRMRHTSSSASGIKQDTSWRTAMPRMYQWIVYTLSLPFRW